MILNAIISANPCSNQSASRKFITSLLMTLLSVAPLSTAGSTVISTAAIISGSVNGQPLSGSGIITSDTSTGVSTGPIAFSSFPSTFEVFDYGKSFKTKHHPYIAAPIGTAVDFFQLSPQGYSFNSVITYDNGLGTIETTGSEVSTGTGTSNYTLNISGSYSGPLGAVGVQVFPAVLTNSGSPGGVSMTDREIIQFATGSTLGFSEVANFSLFSGVSLPISPEFLTVNILQFSFDRSTNTMILNTAASVSPMLPRVPEPGSFELLLSGLVLVWGVFRLGKGLPRRPPQHQTG